jgi:hypothetical protein
MNEQSRSSARDPGVFFLLGCMTLVALVSLELFIQAERHEERKVAQTAEKKAEAAFSTVSDPKPSRMAAPAADTEQQLKGLARLSKGNATRTLQAVFQVLHKAERHQPKLRKLTIRRTPSGMSLLEEPIAGPMK